MLSLLKLIGRPLFRVLFSLEYHGLENVPESGAVILAGNHPSYLDPLLVGMPIKRVILFMAWDALFKVPVLGWFVRSLGSFPVDIRRGRGEAAYRQALDVLKGGHALGIFPEGQRSEQGPMGELRTGVARLAIESGAPIVPITIGGASRAWPKWKLLPRPAKIIVRYHKPIHIEEHERAARGDDRGFHHEVMQRVAASINRSLAPALRGAEGWERWYRQPPSHIRSYEWAPLAAAIITTLVALAHHTLPAHWDGIWLPPAIYYLYLAADLALIKPGRSAKWLRNSMPVWLMLVWHYPLTRALARPAGEQNLLLAAVALAAFFPYFWESYYTLQKFVRGLVVVYYISLAIALKWPHPLGVLVAVLGFIAIFSLWHRTRYSAATVTVMLSAIAIALFVTGAADARLFIYGALSVVATAYLQSFVNVAYDIRKAGTMLVKQEEAVRQQSHGGTI
jgi:1-acyl-sn-glycerol-3-phosphate acyltransferase